MTEKVSVGLHVTGLDDPATPERSPAAWLDECSTLIALLATRDTYAGQPSLWELGEHGRARTIEDFEHHLRAARGNAAQWRTYLDYCLTLFDARGFPFRWLTDAFTTLAAVLSREFPPEVTGAVRDQLEAGEAELRRLASARGIDLARPTRYDS